MNIDNEQRLRDIQREYLDFIDDEDDQGTYAQKVRALVTDTKVRLIVNINDVRKKNAKRAKELIHNGFEEQIAFQRALKDMVGNIDHVYSKTQESFFVGFEGSFGAMHVTPRNLSSRYLGKMVCVEGIVTKCSAVRPKVVKSVHYCPATKKTIERTYTDMTSLDPFPSSAAYPTKDEDGNPLETEYGLSLYKDHQTFAIQEMPEKAPAGQLPRSVDVVAESDLADVIKPGDRVQVIGMYRSLPGKKNGYTTATFRTVLIANNISHFQKESAPIFFSEDIRKIRNFAKQQKKIDIFELLAKSLAPSIHGHEYIKKAVLCQLLGGNEKVLENGTRIRGDINILLIGDPSVAKSQMLRYVLNTAPRAITTTGRGSSGVGLTAAVTTDPESGERRLEAGAMVLGDRGIVCIDEFDKMSDIDRTAIHEVMEQGRVTIAKAGIHASLNARCSVLAAANPIYGKYDQYKTPMENISMQDSLLSRFDLLFIVLDTMDPEHDRSISDHVLRMHQYRAPNEEDGQVLPLTSALDILSTKDTDVRDEEETETQVYEKYDKVLHGQRLNKKEKILTLAFVRKYIHIARDIKPVLTTEAANYISEEYSKLRNQENLQQERIARTQPVTARCLETMIRLSTAHAKARLSKRIEMEDAQCAVELIQFAYFKKVLEKPRGKKRKEDDDSEEDDEEIEQPNKRQRRRSGSEKDPYEFDEEMEVEADTQKAKNQTSTQKSTDGGKITDERLKKFKLALYHAFKKEHSQSLPFDRMMDLIKESGEIFDNNEAKQAIEKMSEDNQVMMANDTIFLI